MDKTAQKFIAENIYSMVGFKPIRDCRTIYDMNKYFKENGFHFTKGDVSIAVEQWGKPVAKATRRWSARRVCLEYKELKPQIEWITG